MATTLRDVAGLARVSVKTVSNVVHDHPHVSADVRHRVEEAIRQLGYEPDLAARALRTGRSGLLGLGLTGVDPPGVADQLVRFAAAAGFRVVLEPPGASAGQLRVDALLLGVAPERAPAGVPVVLLSRPPDPRFDCVAPDAVQAARDATDHLVQGGRRRIAAVGARPGDATEPHTIGYQQALRHAGLPLPPGYLRPTAHQRHADGYHATRELLAHEQRPDAIFCGTDPLAIGAMRAVTDAGLRVPEDVAVIGVGDSAEGRYSRPTLTTVAADPAVIARRAVDLVTDRLRGTAGNPVRIVVPHVVLPRESTTGPTVPGPPG